ncbi:hypothetical protein F3Y22_tig00110503pilonHSYRG00608 [Hibiscus syriacus]|uniref:Uncharacterized protein n=1 Tax=Hibiscus syriacus TaxID=106335 RepID=A0A6A3AFQ0_HIBSY|nr:hypothetical protein F3Y22_tig00110503pilonHSYRG00608 [Hibiscus syriacus]
MCNCSRENAPLLILHLFMTSVAHMDSPKIVDTGFSQMLKLVVDHDLDADLDVHLVGGVVDVSLSPNVCPLIFAFVVDFFQLTNRLVKIVKSLRSLSDSDILTTCSTSPLAEGPDFVENEKRSLGGAFGKHITIENVPDVLCLFLEGVYYL